MSVSVSVLIPVYNNVRNLELVLCGLELQSFQDFEVVIGDDGSGEEMREFIQSYHGPFPLQYVWHPDEGFRRSKILNEAAKKASGNYFIFMDSDCIPHTHFVHDHWQAHKSMVVLCGRRVDLGERLTKNLKVADIKYKRHQRMSYVLLQDILQGKTINWEESIRLPFQWMGRLIHWKSPSLLGSNFSLERSLFVRINGFNEDYVGYGLEDSDLSHRLQLAGARLKTLRHYAIQYHIDHPKGQDFSPNVALFERTLQLSDPVCKNGLRKL